MRLGLKQEADLTLKLLVYLPFENTKHFERDEIESSESVCSRHHGAFKHNRRKKRLVFNKHVLHIINIV